MLARHVSPGSVGRVPARRPALQHTSPFLAPGLSGGATEAPRREPGPSFGGPCGSLLQNSFPRSSRAAASRPARILPSTPPCSLAHYCAQPSHRRRKPRSRPTGISRAGRWILPSAAIRCWSMAPRKESLSGPAPLVLAARAWEVCGYLAHCQDGSSRFARPSPRPPGFRPLVAAPATRRWPRPPAGSRTARPLPAEL
jgi:hypothetical protein